MITLVIPVYKIKEEFLRKCLESILNQTNAAWKCILVDDGSPDNSGQILDEYAGRDERFSVVHQQNQGVSVARNQGIDRAVTEWVTFIDPDDWISENYVEIALEAIKNSMGADILTFGYAREFSDMSREEYLLDKSQRIPEDLLLNMRLAPLNRLIVDGKVVQFTVNAIWNKIYRVSYLDMYGIRFEPSARKGQDRVFNMSALDKTDNIYYVNALLYHYRNDNEDSIVNRYNPSTVQNSKIVLNLMLSWIRENSKDEKYLNMLNCWTCTRLQEYMRLYYFNKKRTGSYIEVKRELNALLAEEPFISALKMNGDGLFTREEKVFLFFLRKKQYWVCKYLISIREFLKKIKNKNFV